jgi:tetraprenyl-beta-curcumene synthase
VPVASTSPSLRQLRALLAVYARELAWVAPQVAREVRGWRERAAAIADPALREDALTSLERERLNIEGAALFSVVPRRRDARLLRVLVAYQIVLDYLDTLSERIGGHPPDAGLALHRALVEALDPTLPITDHYRLLPWPADDGGYLLALLDACRSGCVRLPGYARVKAPAVRAAERFVVQVANHDPLPARRDATLLAWAAREFPLGSPVAWFEQAAAASSTLGIHALLALAAGSEPEPREVAAVDAAYAPWICAASTLLDSFVDQQDDLRSGSHNYLAHYASPELAVQRLREIVVRSVAAAGALERGERHVVIVCGMIAMYLSKRSVSSGPLRGTADELLRAAGALARLERPILRWLRRRHGTRDA